MASVRISDFGSGGLNTDLPPVTLPLSVVTDLLNSRVSDGAIQSAWGQVKLIDLQCKPQYHTAYLDSLQKQWVIISDGEVVWAQAVDGTSNQEITPPTGDWTLGRVTFANLNGVQIVNSETDGPFYWPGTGTVLTPLPGPGSGTIADFVPSADPGDLNQVASRINAMNWTGHPKASGTALNIWSGDLLVFKGEDSTVPGTYVYYDYNGPRPVTVGIGGNHVVLGSELSIRSVSQAEIDSFENGWNWTLGWRCVEMAAVRYNLVALGMVEDSNEYYQKIRWSNSAEEGSLPLEWVISATNDAGDDLLGETAGKIITARKTRDQLFIVKEDSVYGMSWIGGTFIFQITRLEGGSGTPLPQGCTEMRGRLVILTAGDVLVFDGQNSDSLVDRRVRNLLNETLSSEFWSFSQVFFHAPSSMLFIAGAQPGSIGQLTGTLLFDLNDQQWGQMQLGFGHGFDEATVEVSGGTETWDDLTTLTWDEMIEGSWDRSISQSGIPSMVMYEANSTDTAWWLSAFTTGSSDSAGLARTCSTQRGGIPLGQTRKLIQVNEVWPELEGQLLRVNSDGSIYTDPISGETELAPLRLRVGFQDSPNGPITWAVNREGLDYFDVWPGSGSSVDPRITGRLFCWEIESFGIGWWRFDGLTVDFEDGGEK